MTTTANADATLLIERANAFLIRREGYFASRSVQCAMVPDASIDTACTNGKRIKYNPAFIADLPLMEVVGTLIHEVMHITDFHHIRMVGKDPQEWNIATDFTINERILAAGYPLPKGALVCPPEYRNLSAEEIYWRRQQNAQQQPQPQQPTPGDGPGKASNDPGQCGGVEVPTNEDGSALSPSELARVEQEAMIDTLQAAQQAKGRGQLPASVKELVKRIRAPKEDWRAITREFVEDITNKDYSWMRPNRRWLASTGFYLPSLAVPSVSGIVAAMDTSGSIDDHLAAAFLAEQQSILDTLSPESLRIIQCDSRVQSDATYTPGDVVDTEIHGRGGTDFTPVFDLLRDDPPRCLIYLTDMDGDFPPYVPDYPVLWIAYGDGKDATPPFGRLITAESD